MKVKQVKVVFESSMKRYNYLCALDVKVGDKVLVQARDSWAVVELVEISGAATGDEHGLRWVIAKPEDLDKEVQMDILKWREMQKLRLELEERRREFERTSLWTMLAEKDPVAADLMRQLNELSK